MPQYIGYDVMRHGNTLKDVCKGPELTVYPYSGSSVRSKRKNILNHIQKTRDIDPLTVSLSDKGTFQCVCLTISYINTEVEPVSQRPECPILYFSCAFIFLGVALFAVSMARRDWNASCWMFAC